ncbi:MAG: helix-turn-helix domain containing protein [Mycobacterium sp.]|nr:helix-turn-helix domain containing protein [Mycobacterium sp.]
MDDADSARRQRADRILDGARDLLLRWGYRRVTIDEVARKAGVGKGTIYLHWRSREQLFQAVSAREAAAMTAAIIDGLQADSAEVALHRHLRRLFVEAMSRPVLRALYTRDADTLDAFLTAKSHVQIEEVKREVNRDYHGVLAAHGMVRADLNLDVLDYTLSTIVFGFFAAEPFLSPAVDLNLEQKADQLADTVRRAFEPPKVSSAAAVKQAAAQAVPIFGRLADHYLAQAYGGDLA